MKQPEPQSYTEESVEEKDIEPPGTLPLKAVRHGSAARKMATSDKPTIRYVSPKFRVSPNAIRFQKKFFPDASRAEWNDWRWQLRQRFQTLDSIRRFLRLSADEEQALARPDGGLAAAITPYYASLLDPDNPAQPVRRTVVPVMSERLASPGEADDPLGEDHQSPVPGLVHRYPDRVLFLSTGYCSAYCRYCTRSRMVGDGADCAHGPAQWQAAVDYIAATPAVRDVLVSGGDPLTLPDEALDWILSRLRDIPHVEIIRLGTKTPAVLPQRITPELVKILKKYHPLFMSLHFAHPDELTRETEQACGRLADAGIPLGSQTVLLRGVNDNVETMTKLMQGLLRMRVKPYYLYQCDPITGSAHFRTTVETGLRMIEGLRGHTSGYAIPNFVIDAPGGGGKIPLLPQTTLGYEDGNLLLRNYEGKVYRYPDHV